MNIYKRKKELYDTIYLFYILFTILFVLWASITIICMSSSSFPFIYLIWSTTILFIIFLIFRKMMNTVEDNMDDIEKTLTKNFWEEEMLTMIKTFNDEQFNKILEVSRSLDKNNEEIEKNNFNKRIQEIKDKYNI